MNHFMTLYSFLSFFLHNLSFFLNLAYSFLFTIQVKSKLTSKESEVSELTSEFEEKCELTKSLQDQLSNMEGKQNAQDIRLVSLQKEKDDCLAKLSVLSNFYEEKERQLKK